MSLLTIAQAVADEMNSVRPTSVIGNGLPDVQKVLRLAQRVGSDLATRVPWQVLRTQRVFTAIAGNLQPGILPSDFYRIVPETMWDRTNMRLIAGPRPAVDWQGQVATQYDGWARWWTRRGNDVLIFPAMQGGEQIAFEYQSIAFCQSAGGAPQTAWAADTDTGRISEELITLGVIARLTENEGLANAAAARADFELRLAQEYENDTPSSRVRPAGDLFTGSRHSTDTPAPDGGAFGWPYY